MDVSRGAFPRAEALGYDVSRLQREECATCVFCAKNLLRQEPSAPRTFCATSANRNFQINMNKKEKP
jgi:hypothetical protein